MPTVLDVTNKEDQTQSNQNMNIQAWTSQEEMMKNLTTTLGQNRNPHSDQAEQAARQTACQPTLHSVENNTYYMDGHGNLEDGISIHGPRSQGPRNMLLILTKSTNSATRSPTRQFYNEADT